MMTKRLLETFGLILMAGSMMNCMGGAATGPATCKDAKTAYGVSSDGPQTLYVGGDKAMPWSAFCVGMTSDAPVEYLELPQYDKGGNQINFSEYVEASGAVAAATETQHFTVRTHYDRVRIDPVDLTVDISNSQYTHFDRTFRPTAGDSSAPPTSNVLKLAIGSVPFGASMQCGQVADMSGANIAAKANIDLDGTPFVLSQTQFCGGVTGLATPDPSSPDTIVNFTALGETSASSVMTCGRASINCLSDPGVNGQVGGQKTIQLSYAGTQPGFGF
jgi:hypothetical protein